MDQIKTNIRSASQKDNITPVMNRGVGKALYVFLCMIMGMILFAIFHRAVVVIYYILLNTNYETFSFGITEATVQAIDFFTLLVALFFGGWYGTALGLHWYRLVYEEKPGVGLFHGFIPHHWRDGTVKSTSLDMSMQSVKKPSKIVHTDSAVPSRINSFDVFKTFKSAPKEEPKSWDFDDLQAASPPEVVTPKAPVKRTSKIAAPPKVTKPRKVLNKAPVRTTRVKAETKAV